MSSLREEIYNLLDDDDAYNDHETIDLDYCVDNILKIFEKRIDELKQQEITYITGNDNGTEEMADNVNDILSECYWHGVKGTINKLKDQLK